MAPGISTCERGLAVPGRATQPTPLPRQLAAEPVGVRVPRRVPTSTPPKSVTIRRLRIVLGERLLQVLDRPFLHRPQFRGIQRREGFQFASHLGVEVHQPEQFLGTMEAENLPATGVGFEKVRELSDRPGAFIGEWQGRPIEGDCGRQRPGILGGLGFDPDEGMPLRLRLDDPDGLPPT